MEIVELRDRVLSLPALNKKLDTLQKEIREAEDEAAALLYQYERENRDVLRMKEDSFSSFLYKLAGKYGDKLEKEQREEINAKIAYDRAVARLDGLVRDKEALASRIDALLEDKRSYETELENRRRKLSAALPEPDGRLWLQLKDERNALISQRTEIDEALRALYRAKSTSEKISKSLDSAEGWATFDVFARGGIISHMAKYSHIDEAEENFNVLSRELRALQSELSDVQGLSVSGLTGISSGQRTVDFWFDNIFTDLSVRSQIKENAGQINGLIRNLNNAEALLKEKYRNRENALLQNKQREEELLLSLSQCSISILT